MADKNVKAELNAENLEGVAGGAERRVIYEDDGDGNVKVLDVDKLEENHPLKQNGAPWRDKDLHSEKRPPENKDEEPRHDVEF